MKSNSQTFRRSAVALGYCALLFTPLTGFAQEAKPADAQQTPANGDAYTLRLQFKKGAVNRYKTQVKTSVISPAGVGGEVKTVDADTTAFTEQKVTKTLDNGNAEIVTTLLNVKTDGKNADVKQLSPVTSEVMPNGKVAHTTSQDAVGADAMKSLFESSLSSPQSFLPDGPVKIGDKWTQKMALTGPLSGTDGTMACDLKKVETVGGVKTAFIHAIMSVPLRFLLDLTGQPTKAEDAAMAVFAGTIHSDMEIQFAIDEGRITKTTSAGNSDIAITLGKAAPAEAAGFLPKDAKVTMKMALDMNLLAPGEKIEEPKAAEAKPGKK